MKYIRLNIKNFIRSETALFVLFAVCIIRYFMIKRTTQDDIVTVLKGNEAWFSGPDGNPSGGIR